MADGVEVVLSPVQLAAILSDESIGSDETKASRLWGGVKLIAGSLEMVGAAALLIAPEPTMLTKAGGVALATHGTDTLTSGFWQVWTGVEQRTLTDQAAEALALRLGADPSTATTIGTAVDIAVPLGVSAGAAALRIVAIRTGRISLAAHEAATGSRLGGHTILKHIAKTEPELRARLAAERIPVASSFKSLEVAERVLHQALRANKLGIERWARSARPGARESFYYLSSSEVGYGVVRSTGKLVQMRSVQVVLKMEQFKGQLYYILTSYPVL